MSNIDTSGEPSQGSLSIPVIAEELVIEKQIRTTASVRVTKSVQRREEIVDVPLVRSTIEVERVPVNILLEEQPFIRQEGGTTIYPVFKEVAVVVTKFLLKEEVRISRCEVSEPHTESVVLRTEEVSIRREELPLGTVSSLDKLSNLPPFTDGAFCLSETVEEPLIVKRARVIEEIVLQKTQSQHTEVVRETVRRSQISSEPDDVRSTPDVAIRSESE